VPQQPRERLDALHFARSRPDRFVRGDRVLLHVRSGRRDGPAFLLVHGIGVGCRYFAPLIPLLEEQGTVLTVELPGFDRAPKPRDVLTVEDHAALLADFLREQGDRVVAVGHSMGAQIVADLAARSPDVVAAVALLGPVTDPRERTAWQQGLRLAQDTLREPPRANQVIFTDYARTGPVRYLRTLPSMLQYDLAATLPRIGVPALVLRGSRDPICRHDFAVRLTELLPAGRLVEVPGAPHVEMWLRPDLVAAELGALAVAGAEAEAR
jgi:pimeloyl-ACP methyl ester carboxylesterase